MNDSSGMAELLQDMTVREEAIRNHQEELASHGLTVQYADTLGVQKRLCSNLDAQQEELKSKQKEMTARLNEEKGKLEKMDADTKAVIKVKLAKELWTEFGIGGRDNRSLAALIQRMTLRAQGISKHQPILAATGFDSFYVDRIEEQKTLCATLDAQQEKLKAQEMEKTDALNQALAKLEAMDAESKALIKVNIPQVLWGEFAIHDKRFRR